MNKKIAVAGIGYVGLSLAVLLAQNNEVVAVDIDSRKVDSVNRRKSPIKDNYIEKYLSEKHLNLQATVDGSIAYRNAEYVIVAAPTNYDSEKNTFNTEAVLSVIRQVIQVNPDAIIIIKSTVPVGYTEKVRKEVNFENILFSPEFLRESKALFDNLYPSRIIVGLDKNNKLLDKAAHEFVNLLEEGAIKENISVLYMNYTEAEAVKLFSNTYLALRVSYFNELDTYAEMNGLDAKAIIDGVCLDPRIGDYYNNPSFGYGGYCLPKDTKQLLANYLNIPQNIIGAVVQSNQTRKEFITEQILSKIKSEKEKSTIGIYRLSMKTDSDNFRDAAILDVIRKLKDEGTEILIYEPILKDQSSFMECEIENDFTRFIERSDVIAANRYDSELDGVSECVYTRDLYQSN